MTANLFQEREKAQLLGATLQEAVVKCSERCLYQSAKWYGQVEAIGILALTVT